MSYSGTVYCSYCGNRGHNRVSCKKRKNDIRLNPDSWMAREEAALVASRKQAAQNRKCTYCHTKGHNRRTCEVLKSDKGAVTEKLISYREKILHDMTNIGLGVGTMVSFREYSNRYHHLEGSYDVAAVVTGIKWDSISYKFSLDPFSLTYDENNFVNAMVVGTSLSPEEFESQTQGWSRPLKPTQHINISAMRFAEMLFTPGAMELSLWKRDGIENLQAKILTKAKEVAPPKTFLNPPKIPEQLGDQYNFNPHQRDRDPWSRERNELRLERHQIPVITNILRDL